MYVLVDIEQDYMHKEQLIITIGCKGDTKNGRYYTKLPKAKMILPKRFNPEIDKLEVELAIKGLFGDLRHSLYYVINPPKQGSIEGFKYGSFDYNNLVKEIIKYQKVFYERDII